MKKQIFILVLAVFVISFSNSYAQVLVPRAIDITCLPSDALHPIAGTPYNYVVNIPTPAGTKSYEWFVTQEPNFIAAGALTTIRENVGDVGSHIIAAGTGYNSTATGAATLSLTWNAFVYDPLAPVFVVIQIKSTEASACTPNNLKVYRIEPVNAFTLDIANVKPDRTVVAFETPISICMAPILSAVYDAAASGSIKYDFGIDYLYFIVAAANFSTAWLPSLQIEAIEANETVTAVEWFRPVDNTYTTPGAMPFVSGALYTATTPVPALNTTGTVGSAGEAIIIRVTIDHTSGIKQYEGIAPETITVSVDGKTQLALTPQLGDIHFSNTIGIAADCGKVDAFRNDKATQVINPRPDVVSATPKVPGPGNSNFLPIN